jgi:RHS repeat-associated protein
VKARRRGDPASTEAARVSGKNRPKFQEVTVQTVDAKAQIATISYNGRQEWTGTLFADGTRITLTYDARGLLIEARDITGITTQSADARGLLSAVVAPSHPNGVAITYGFDSRRLRTQMALGTARHTYAFDALWRNTGYTDPDGGRATWTFDGANAITEQVNPNGTATTWTFDSRGLISGIRHRKSDGTELGVDLYGFDANANPITKSTLGGRNTWGYDALDQLTSEKHELRTIATWVYNTVGSRISQDLTQGGVRTVTSYEYDAAEALTRITQGTAVTTVTFDANGNQVSEQSAAGLVTYLWNPRDLLTGYQQPDGKIATFAHGFDDLRSSVNPGDGSAATKFVWDPLSSTGYDDLLAETAVDQSVPRQYWRGARLVSYKEAAQKGVYQFDHLGNTERLTDPAQAVLASYRNSAWGETLATTGSLTGQRFQFGGEWGAFRDTQSADLWMRARVMKPSLGRFLSVDEIEWLGRDLNPYAYVANTPLLMIDPSGYNATAVFSMAAVAEGLAALIGGAVTVAMVVAAIEALGITLLICELVCLLVPGCAKALRDEADRLLNRIREWIRENRRMETRRNRFGRTAARRRYVPRHRNPPEWRDCTSAFLACQGYVTSMAARPEGVHPYDWNSAYRSCRDCEYKCRALSIPGGGGGLGVVVWLTPECRFWDRTVWPR